jgi:RNA-directed DNA polymerase
MTPAWLKPRRYRHFDLPINEAFASKATNPAWVARHAFTPLLHYSKAERRYKKCPRTGVRTITVKDRPIKYASHRDACILGYYAHQLNQMLESHYRKTGLSDSAIAYRALGQANYNFAANVLSFAKSHAPTMILAFDVTSFFDRLDHRLLKQRLNRLLGTPTLPDDWYKVFRFITRFYYVDRKDIEAHPTFGLRLKERSRDRIASVEELKAAGISFHPNPELVKGHARGIPQGTPISATISNVYMLEFDAAAKACCDNAGALYRRYSDDILILCKPADAAAIESEIMRLIGQEKLEIAPHKTEKTLFDSRISVPRASKAAQYLGFTLDEAGPAIRESSLARQWRKMRSAIRRARKSAAWRLSMGKPGPIHMKKLYRRFSYIALCKNGTIQPLRSFSSYGRRSAKALGAGEKVSQQIRRFERTALREMAALKVTAPHPDKAF